jgi:hypothetical protein
MHGKARNSNLGHLSLIVNNASIEQDVSIVDIVIHNMFTVNYLTVNTESMEQ